MCLAPEDALWPQTPRDILHKDGFGCCGSSGLALLGAGTAQELAWSWGGAPCLFWAVAEFSPVAVSCGVSGGLEKVLTLISTGIGYFLRSAL